MLFALIFPTSHNLESKATDLDSQDEHELAVQVREWAEMYRAEATRRGLSNKIEYLRRNSFRHD